MAMVINQNKINAFYREIVEQYPSQVKEAYWGSEDDYKTSIEGFNIENENVIINMKEGRLSLPSDLFEFLFTGKEMCDLNEPVGKRYRNSNYTCIELKVSPILKIEEGIKSGLYPITLEDDRKPKSCFFINSDKTYYPSEIIPFFVAQLQNRLNKRFDNFPEIFLQHFEPIKYAIRIENDKNNLCIKLLYKLAAELGLIENELTESNQLPISQNLADIIDGENNMISITNENIEHLSSLKYFISAVANINPYYRFLNFYNVFESLFYKHFYTYVKNLTEDPSLAQNYEGIKKHIGEPSMLKLVLKHSMENDEEYLRRIKDDLNKYATTVLERIGLRDININSWETNNIDKFCDKLAEKIIYKLRNAIVHSKEDEKYIERIADAPDLTKNFIDITNLFMELSKKVIETNVDEW